MYDILQETTNVYTPEEVAKRLKVSGGTIRNLIKKQELFAYQIGDQYRIPQYALDQWLSPFRGVNWESLGFGMWQHDKSTRRPADFVRKLRTTDQNISDYLNEIAPEK